MAFSTQKEFFHVPYMNETFDFECQEVCVKLKSYPSTVDDRSWAADEDKKSRFVADLVACNTPIGGRRGQGAGPDDGSRPDQGAGGQGVVGAGRRGSRAGTGPAGARTGPGAGAFARTDPGYGRGAARPDGQYGSNLIVGDSLINAADGTIARMQDLMVKNNVLQQRLADSDAKLETAKDENDDIKRIMAQSYDPEKSKALKKKIKELADAKKINPADEKELNDLQKAIDDMNKAHDILKAENANLKRLIEKQSKRCKMESLDVDPENSSDVPYLRNKINNLAKELALLRQAEDEQMKAARSSGSGADGGNRGSVGGAAGKGSGRTSDKYSFTPDKDAANIQKILAERDALRKKTQALADLEKKVNELQKKAAQAERISGDLEGNLNEQDRYINDMENEMQEMQKYYETEVDKSKCNEAILKCRCDDMKKELQAAKCAASRAECQQMEIDVLRNELRKRDVALNAYDCQYQQLMNVICELNQKYGNQRGDCVGLEAAECPDVGDDLAFYTGATLDHIMNELCKQADCFRKMNQNKSPGATHINSLDDCTRELERLKKLLKQKDGQLGDLIEENECLCQAADESNKRLNELDRKVQQLDEDTKFMEEGMRESIGLIQDIGDVAKENDKLKDQLNNFKDTESRNLLEDLQRQLEECRQKNRVLQEMNRQLSDALDNLGGNPEVIQKEVAQKEDQRKIEEKRKKEDQRMKEEAQAKPEEELAKPGVKKEQYEPVKKVEEKPKDRHSIGATEKYRPEERQEVTEEEKPLERPRDRTEEKPGESPAEITVVRTSVKRIEEKRQDEPEKKPKDRPEEKPKDRPEEKPKDRPEEKAKDRPEEKPKDRPEEKPQDRPEEKAKDRPEDKPKDKPEEKPKDRPEEKIKDRPEEKPKDKPDEKPKDKPEEKPKDRSEERPKDRSEEKPKDRPEEKPKNRPEEKPKDRPEEKPKDKPEEKPKGKPEEKPKEQKDDGRPEEKRQEKPEETTDDKPEEKSKTKPDKKPREESKVDEKKPLDERRADEKPIGKEDKGKDKPEEKRRDTPKEKPEEESKGKPTEKEKPKPEADKSGNKRGDRPREKPEDKREDRPTEKPGEKRGDRPGEKRKERPGEKPEEKRGDKPAESAPERKAKPAERRPEGDEAGGKRSDSPGQETEDEHEEDSRSPGRTPEDKSKQKPKKTPGQKQNEEGDEYEDAGRRRPTKAPGKKPGQEPDRGDRGDRGETPRKKGDKKPTDTGKRPVRGQPPTEDDIAPGDGSKASPYYSRATGRSGGPKRQRSHSRGAKDTTDEQFDEFVKQTVQSLSAGEIDGIGLERELRKILDMFIEECGFCFCKCNIPKSRFYAICHKLYHHGLHTLDFKDLAYMHKRIFAAAENILPGCLFNIIIKDMPVTNYTSAAPPTTTVSPVSNQQCCTCKSALCCDPNEEKLMLKVKRLEQDIENAKMCLQNLKSIPSNLSITNYGMEAGDHTTEDVRPKRHSKQIKQLKQRYAIHQETC